VSQPYENPSKPRRRRADRHYPEGQSPAPRRAAYPPEEEAPMPLGGYDAARVSPAPPAPGTRPAPRVYQEEDYAPPRRDPEPYRQEAYEAEDYYEDEHPRRWPKVIAALLVLAIGLFAASYFFIPDDATGILGQARQAVTGVVDSGLRLVGLGKKDPPTLIKFETAEEEVVTGVKTVFTFTADDALEGVRVLNGAGVPLTGSALPVDQPDNKVWTFSSVMGEPISGTLTAGIMYDGTWYQTDKSLFLSVVTPSPEPTATPTPTPVPTPTLAATLAPTPEPGFEALSLPSPTVQAVIPEPLSVQELLPVFTPLAQTQEEPEPEFPEEEIPEDMLVQDDFTPLYPEEPVLQGDEGSPEPLTIQQLAEIPETLPEELPEDLGEAAPVAEEPTLAPVAELIPTATPQPQLVVQAAGSALPSGLGIIDDAYQGARKLNDYSRAEPLNVPAGSAYTSYEGGVFTFRGDALRQNAAFGTTPLDLKQLTIQWQTDLGSLRTEDSGTVYGLGWTGQPAIVKWAVEVRQMMNLAEEKKGVTALKEVIAAGQDGKVYFVDLNDGVPTREPIDVGYPLKGSVAVDTQGRPIIAFGQGISKLPGKTGAIGYYLYSLIDQKELHFINGRRTDDQRQYSTNGAFDGTALFDLSSDSMVVAGENGLLYTVKLNTVFDFLDKKTITVDPEVIYLRSKAGKQNDTTVSVETSVAMYGPYAYLADKQGILRCVDTTSMQTLWAFDVGDNTDAAIALELKGEGLDLYTGTTVLTRLRRDGKALIRRINALTGEEIWQKEVAASFDNAERAGVKASPVVGQNSVSHLVYFTVNQTEEGGTILALDKDTGDIVWQMPIRSGAVSSPVAVYDEAGQAVIIQAGLDGTLYMLDGLTGQVHSTLDLGGQIEGSPAVYNDMLVIGTSSRDNHKLYGIRIE